MKKLLGIKPTNFKVGTTSEKEGNEIWEDMNCTYKASLLLFKILQQS